MSRTLSLLLLLVLCADALLMFLVPVMVYAYTTSLAWSGMAYAMAWLPRIMVTPLVGVSIDRWGVRRVSVASDLVKCGGCLLAVLALRHEPTAPVVALCSGLLGGLVAIGNAQSLIAYEKMIALVSRDVDRDVNLLCRLDQSAMIIGPLAGFVGYTAGALALLMVAAVMYAINAACYGFSRVVPRQAAHVEDKAVWPTSDNMKFIFFTPVLLSSVMLACGNNAFDGLVEAGAATVIDRVMQLPVHYFAFVDICAGICGVAATLLYPRLSLVMPPLRLFTVAAGVTALAGTLMVFVQAYLLGFLALYALNIGGKVFMINFCRSLRIRVVPVERLASVSSVMVLLNQAVLPVVGLTLYWVGEHPQWLSALMLAALALTLLATGRVRHHARARPVPSGERSH
ncbi:MFS transporter [Pseudomonas fulva]|nr:MFS transporter [Pseudomonas fulva]MBF8780704.1 MFS transporter [Pseudomonas fulva]